jgi:hypothetical protein
MLDTVAENQETKRVCNGKVRILPLFVVLLRFKITEGCFCFLLSFHSSKFQKTGNSSVFLPVFYFKAGLNSFPLGSRTFL